MASNFGLDAEPSDELQLLLAQQADIQARIASLTTGPPQHSRSPIYKHQPRRRDDLRMTRSISGSERLMPLQRGSDRIDVPLERSMSQCSVQSESMVRTSSKLSTSSGRVGNLPFTGTMAPPFVSNSGHDNPAIEAWQTQEQPLSSYTLSHQPHQHRMSTSHRRRNLERVPELVLQDPATWMARNCNTPPIALTPSPVLPSSNFHLTSSTHHDVYSTQLPTTPSSDVQSLTTATTLNSNTMSRQNSIHYENLPESIEMMRFNSQTSFSTDLNDLDQSFAQVSPLFTSSHHVHRSSDEEQSQFLVGVGGTSHDSQFSLSFTTSVEPLAHQFSSPGMSSILFGEKMEKSNSSESTSSTSSSVSSRSKHRLQEQIAAARPLMPKGGDGTAMSRDNSSQSMTRIQSKDAQDKIAISKPTYQRPKHDRVFCPQCEEYPDGFRGEHELRRHQDRQHKVIVKKWVCITPTKISDGPKPAVPLSKCKACTQQQKKYGAYYNAAAHLRRAHFRPRAKGRSRTSNIDDGARRGGKGGGNWPTMEDLKQWMMEVEETAANFPPTVVQQEDADASEDDIDDVLNIDDAQQLGMQMYENNFYNTSPTDFFGIPVPMNANQHSQNAFPTFQNDSFGSMILQNLDDQFGLNSVPFPSFQ